MKINPLMKEELRKFLLRKMNEKDEEVSITSAYSLSATEINGLKKALPALKSAKVNVQVDPNLIAGFVIKKGSKVVDLSLQTQLRKIQQLTYEAA